jgi:glucosamine-6-phosphate deaminase
MNVAPSVRVVRDTAELRTVGADLVSEAISAASTGVLVPATGRTPIGVYDELGERWRAGDLDTSALAVAQLDEYLGLAAGDRRSLFDWMHESFLGPLGIDEANVMRLPLEGDLPPRCGAFDEDLTARGGIDIAILGLGRNGHLGFNEPPCPTDAPTRAVVLTPTTIEANAGYWGTTADVPAQAVTIGIGPLLAAREIVLLVSGGEKRTILRRALEGPVDPDVPASALQVASGRVTVVADEAAWGGP